MSEVKVNKISPRTNCGTVTLGDSGDTFTIPAGATITNSGTAAGFGSVGEVSWNTTVKTTNFTATSGSGFFVNTAGGAVTVTLPSSPSAGNVVAVSDYNSSAASNNITIGRNGSNINGSAADLVISKANSAIQLVYVDATTGWQGVTTANTNDIAATKLTATGGTVSTSGDYKIHTFTGPGTFTVTQESETAPENTVDYLVVAGGGGGGAGCGAGGGGGAGGFRFFASPSTNPQSGNPGSPLNGPAGITVSGQAYPITVGAGGAAGDGCAPGPGGMGGCGSVSTFSTITSTGGGKGAGGNAGNPQPGGNGGSGGGATRNRGSAGSGNTPPTTPSQGSNAGTGTNPLAGNGGGGAMAVGSNSNPPSPQPNNEGGPGGAGAGITGFGSSNGQCSSCVQYFSGGGGGGTFNNATCTPTPGDNARGGIGGGGPGALAPTHPTSPNKQVGIAGTANTGGGGGGGGEAPVVGTTPNDGPGGQGGSGIVVIRYKYQ